MSRPFQLAPLVGLALLACAPDPQAPVRVMALVQSQNRRFEATEVQLQTVTDITALEGSSARLVGGARIVIDPNDPLLAVNGGNLTDEQLRKVFLKDDGGAPEASYVERAGVLWPADFNTWNMVTTYYNFERTVDYFQAMGVPRTLIEGSTVFYFPEFIFSSLDDGPVTDNALYYSPVDGFAILPFDKYQQIPLGMNLGIIGHEFSHLVFNLLVYRGAAVPEPFLYWTQLSAATPQLNILKAFDEGLADYHGHGATCFFPSGCDTRFIESSIDQQVSATETLADRRDMANPNQCVTDPLLNSLNTLNVNEFSTLKALDYQFGTALSTALYQAGQRTGKQRALQEYVLQAYSDTSSDKPGLAQLISANLQTPQFLTLGLVTNTIPAHITDVDLKREVCNELMDHLQLPLTELPDCPASANGGTSCQDITP